MVISRESCKKMFWIIIIKDEEHNAEVLSLTNGLKDKLKNLRNEISY